MDSEQLIAFQRVVREGSFTRAARSLGIGQPAISARIQQLEASFPGPLLERGRTTRLTPLGEAFFPYAARALEAMKEGVEASQLAQAGQRGHLRVASLGSLAGGLLGRAMAPVVVAHPRLDWSVRVGEHERVLTLLLDGAVDLAMVSWPCPETLSADLVELLRIREPVILVAPPKHPLVKHANGHTVTIEELARFAKPLLLLRWWPEHHPEMIRLAQRVGGATVDVPMDTARQLALSGAAIGFFTQGYVAEDLEAGRLVVVRLANDPKMTRESAFVRHARRPPPSEAAATLVDAVRRRATEIGLTVAMKRGR
jgi:DNA-binding transcriptional LysR family regulator